MRTGFLSKREVEALMWLEHGLCTKEIGVKMNVRTLTARNFLAHVSEKTGIKGRYNLLQFIFSGAWRKFYKGNDR